MSPRPFGTSLRALAPALLWTALALLLSGDLASAAATSRIILPLLQILLPHASAESLALIHGLLRKAAHVVEYLILGFLWYRALGERPAGAGRLPAAAQAILIAVLVASLDEGHQALLVSRGGSVFDVGLDTIGAVIGIVGGTLAQWGRPPKGGGVE